MPPVQKKCVVFRKSTKISLKLLPQCKHLLPSNKPLKYSINLCSRSSIDRCFKVSFKQKREIKRITCKVYPCIYYIKDNKEGKGCTGTLGLTIKSQYSLTQLKANSQLSNRYDCHLPPDTHLLAISQRMSPKLYISAMIYD